MYIILHIYYTIYLCTMYTRGHVVTGDLSIIRDVKLRNLIKKGPTYREQNNIDWRVNVKNCKAAVTK